jgi:hypothetical protein
VFFTQPYRRWIVKLANQRWVPAHIMGWLENRLYPDNCVVRFK